MREQERKYEAQLRRLESLLSDQRQKEGTLENDLALKLKVIEDLDFSLEEKEKQIEVLDGRLARQVIVDRNIEKELQDEVGRATGKCMEYLDECDVLNQEFGMLEEENLALRKEITKLRGTNKRLSQVAYGIKGGKRAEKTADDIRLCERKFGKGD